MRILFISLMTATLLGGCHKKTSIKSDSIIDTVNASVIINEKADISITGGPYNIDSLSIAGDVLSIFVNYSGGCKEHTFELISNNAYEKSSPPQLALALKHIDNEDRCRKLVMRELKFNVAKAKYKSSKSVLLKIGKQNIIYNYK